MVKQTVNELFCKLIKKLVKNFDYHLKNLTGNIEFDYSFLLQYYH